MKMILPVFLTLCLGVVPVFSQEVKTPATVAVTDVQSTDGVPAGAEYQEISVLPADEPEAIAIGMNEAAFFGSDVPQFSILRAFGGMGLVLCLLVGAVFGIRKFAPGYFPAKPSDGKNLKIVESLGMGDRRSIALVEVGGKRFLIGSTPQQINLLTALPEHFSLIAEENGIDGVKEEAERATFRNLFDMGKRRSAKHSGKVLPDEIRQKMRRLHEALDNR